MFAKTYIVALVVFLAIDAVWLGLVAKNFYSQQIGFLMKDNINWLAALIFYLLFVFGIVIFVLNPALDKRSLFNAIVFGAFFGLVTYATYDLTNLATIKNWPILVTVVDLLWGMFVAASTSAISYIIITKWIIKT